MAPADLAQPLVEGRPIHDNVGTRRRPAALVIGIVALLTLGVVEHGTIAAVLHNLLRFCAGLGNAAPLLLCCSAALLNLLMLPTFPLMIGAGVIFTNMYGMQLGAAVGTFSVFGGLWLGSVAAFALGRTVFRDFAKRELEQHEVLRIINGMIEKEGVKIVFLARMSPVLPAEVFNYACSLVEALSVPKYAVGCVGSIVPVSFWVTSTAHGTAIAHSGLSGAAAETGTFLIAINVAVLAFLSAALYGAYRRYRSEAEAHIREALDVSNMQRCDSDCVLAGVLCSSGSSHSSSEDLMRQISGQLSKMPPVHPRFYSSSLRPCTAVAHASV